MTDFQCARCDKTSPRLTAPPMPGDMGVRLFEQVCGDCWQEWLKFQTALINHYGLHLRDPKAKQFLTEQTETFFFAANTDES